MSVQEEAQGGRMEGGGREEEEDDNDAYLKRIRDEEGVERQDVCAKRRRIRSENWGASETLQMLELRKAVVQTSTAKGSDAWKQIAQQLAAMNPESQARSFKQVAQRWDTLVKVYVSVEEHCCESGRTCGDVIDERQKRCKTEYRQLWHELIAEGNPGKRRAPSKASVQPDDQTPARLVNDAPQVVTTLTQKFGEIAKSFTEMLDTIDRSITSSEERSQAPGHMNKNIVTGCNWELEEDQAGLERVVFVSGLKKQQDETKAEVARATQSMADTMQSISEAASTSESFCLEVDQRDWSMVIRRLSEISQRYREISVQGIRDEVGADVHDPNSQQQTTSAARSTHDHPNNSIQRSLSLTSSFYISGKLCKKTLSSLNTTRSEKSCSSGKRDNGSPASPATSTATFAGLPDIVHLSPKSDCESLSGSKSVDQGGWTNLCFRNSRFKKGEKLVLRKEKKKRTERRTSILKFQERLTLEEVGEKSSRSMTRTMTRFGPRVQSSEEQKHRSLSET
ncbi:hypothetical protein KC19_3G050500 [Ceratodon purpureus]|uniref:Myb-like domain-containing protein n=1 Tax=Ceratodon purpureus TaxID=3225 RepID=A0A8T0IHB6_CERPU|nr:hypothetical protein KC19_3G050500 [Ceratodon purpureus]